MGDPEFTAEPTKTNRAPLPDRTFGWLRRHEKEALLIAVGVQLMVLVGMVLMKTVPWIGSPTVLLRVEPVDPRDLMRGDYVILSYNVGRVPAGGVHGLVGNGRHSIDQTVYVVLKPEADGRHQTTDYVDLNPPATGTFLRGQLIEGNRIEFGIESYFVQEGKGKMYEKAVRERRLSAEVAVAADGSASLRRLVFD